MRAFIDKLILEIQNTVKKDRPADELSMSIVEDIDLRHLAKEQKWRGFNEDKFKQTIRKMKVEESLEELLELLKD